VTTVSFDSPGPACVNFMAIKWLSASDIFPNVRRFYVKEELGFPIFWNRITILPQRWEHSLETVGYYYNVARSNFPYALLSMFSGIEVVELKWILTKMDDKAFIEDWQFTPSRTASRIPMLLRLPEIHLYFEHQDTELCSGKSTLYPEDRERVFKVAMGWVKAKLPTLALQIVVIDPCSRNCDPFKLNCDRDFVKVRKSRHGSSDGVRTTWTFEL